MKKFISFSGGVESTTMCVLFGGKANAIFSDTGFEHKIMYERLHKVEAEIQKLHPNFKIIRVKNKKHASLQEYIKDYKYYPSVMARFCTRIFKIEPIDDYLRDLGPVELMIGLNADEFGMRTGNHGLVPNVTYSYPLLEANLARMACISILKRLHLEPVFPPYMARGGCIGCFYKSKKEYAAMALLNEEEFDQVIELEEVIQDERGKHYGIRDGIPNMRDFKRLAKSTLFSAEEMYDYKLELQTSCGVFCHR